MYVVDRFEHALTLTVAGLEASLQQHVPAGAYRDFWLWALSKENSQRDGFLQVIGVSQLVKLTITLLDGLVDDRHWHRLADYSVTMNVYQIYEIVSDNLAIGLASPRKGDTTTTFRRDLLRAFNSIMIARLNGDPRPAALLLAPWQSNAQRISSFDQSLNWYKQRLCAGAYLSLRDDLSLEALEYSVWPALVANIETCVELAWSMHACQSGRLLREGLIGRYWAVNRLLDRQVMTSSQLADVGAHAILVMPTLAYYVAVLAESIQPLDHFSLVIQNGTLAKALYDAALLVRLLNDLGTNLIMLPKDERTALVHTLIARHLENPADTPTVADLLSSMSDGLDLFTRLHKDIVFGEFNVGLHGIADVPRMPETLLAFGRNLAHFSQLYARHRSSLQETLDVLNDYLGDDVVSALILRFVQFHEQLYGNPYSMSVGEYAI